MKRRILIFWEGFPVCGLLVSELSKQPDLQIDLYVSSPSVPFDNFFADYGLTPTIISEHAKIELDPTIFDLIVITGWSNKNWLTFAKEARAKNVKTCVVVDNNLRFSPRQILGALYFRLFLRRHFNFAFCPGFLSRKLMLFFGMDSDKVINGNYGAHTAIYNHDPAKTKENEFVVVGQLIQRKGILELLSAYEDFVSCGGDWKLRIIGSGDLREHVQQISNKSDKIIFEDFLQPKDVAERLKSAKVLILPSRLEHWGTVVCEAAACGASLLLSSNVGSVPDLLLPGVNGTTFRSGDANDLCLAMHKISRQSEDWFITASLISRKLASTRTEQTYLNAIRFMLDD